MEQQQRQQQQREPKYVTPKEAVVEILTTMAYNERNIRYVSKHAKIPYGTLYDILIKEKYFIDQERLDAINSIFNTLLIIK